MNIHKKLIVTLSAAATLAASATRAEATGWNLDLRGVLNLYTGELTDISIMFEADVIPGIGGAYELIVLDTEGMWTPADTLISNDATTIAELQVSAGGDITSGFMNLEGGFNFSYFTVLNNTLDPGGFAINDTGSNFYDLSYANASLNPKGVPSGGSTLAFLTMGIVGLAAGKKKRVCRRKAA